MQKWEISKRQSFSDTSIKGEAVGGLERPAGVELAERGGVSIFLHHHALNINSSYNVRPPRCAELLPVVLRSRSTPPLSPCLFKLRATGYFVGRTNKMAAESFSHWYNPPLLPI